MMETLNVYMKSGHTIKIICDKWEFTFDNRSGEYSGYSFEGIKEPIQIGLVPSQIAGYTVDEADAL